MKIISLKIDDLIFGETENIVALMKKPRNSYLTKGEYHIKWDAKNSPSGKYFYRLQMDDLIETKKMSLEK